MTTPEQPEDKPAPTRIGPGTDVAAEDEHRTSADRPATSDPAEFDGDRDLGGMGGDVPGGSG